MITLTSRLVLETQDWSIFDIRTEKTFYRAVVRDQEVNLVGPGVEESFTIGDEIPDHISLQGAAVMAVVLFEEGDE